MVNLIFQDSVKKWFKNRITHSKVFYEGSSLAVGTKIVYKVLGLDVNPVWKVLTNKWYMILLYPAILGEFILIVKFSLSYIEKLF